MNDQPAKPLTTISAASLISILNREDKPESNQSPEEQENRARSAQELAMIFELNESAAFQWFERTFLTRCYQAAFDNLRSPNTAAADLADAHTKYLALREIKVAVLEREIAHRELLYPGDDMIPLLRAKLLLL